MGIIGFDALVHEPGGFERDGVTQLGVGHAFVRRLSLTSLSGAAARLNRIVVESRKVEEVAPWVFDFTTFDLNRPYDFRLN